MPTKFDFVSPEVQLREIDQSQIPAVPEKDGILLIGRARSGPAMKPIKVNNLNDFVEIFGNPMDGVRQEDPWRQGNTGAPNYAAYAAQAYLAAGIGPVKYVRLLGLEKNVSNPAGWNLGTPNATIADNKGAFGLFLVPSGAAEAQGLTASLGAVFYCDGAGIGLSGSLASGSFTQTDGSASCLVQSVGSDAEFKIAVSQSGGTTYHTINFNENSPNYIRTVLRTDPTLLKASSNYANSTDAKFFLGESFDVNVQRTGLLTGSQGTVYGFIAALKDASNDFDNFKQELTYSKSGWFIGAKPSQKFLFRLIALDAGEEFQKNYYTQISNIKLSTSIQPTASFTLSLYRRASSRDILVESYTNLNLDPTDANYIVKRIGDVDTVWDKSTQKFATTGKYTNVSNFVRVEIGSNISRSDVPFGFIGPKNPTTTVISGGTADANEQREEWIYASGTIGLGNGANQLIEGWPLQLTASIGWPTFGLTSENSNNGGNYSNTSVFGLNHVKSNRLTHDQSFGDIALGRVAISPHIEDNASTTDCLVFTLDDIRSGSVATEYYFESGSYDSSLSISSMIGLTGTTGLIDGLRIRQFRAPFFGGLDGVDRRYADPFSNSRLGDGVEKYPSYSLEQALEMNRDKDLIRYELISVPGLVNSTATDRLIDIAEERGDCLAVIDLSGIEQSPEDNDGTRQPASINTTISTISTRQIDSSYACTFYPNVRLKDTLNGNETVLVSPPSVASIGAIARSEAVSQPWFAPAGFNRGGLSRLGGNRGPVVVGTIEHLTKDDRDVLYSSNVNPIARFPATGDTVIFGQKTLQQGASALDRINVRRLMIYLKRQIGDIADTILFDQNVQATWNRFKTRADAVLSEVQSELGITEYKLVLDETTTTPDLIDRNILYAQIYVKPARSIEFIAIDFVITQTGVEF